MAYEQWSPVRFVSSIEEARASIVPYGFRALMLDSNKDSFYIKQQEPDGSVSVTEYAFTKVEPPKPVEYATKDDIDEIRGLLNELVAERQSNAADADIPGFVAAQRAQGDVA